MGTALSWLNDLMVWLGRWVPRLVLVRATHRGVLFGFSGRVRELTPGVRVYWPIVHELELVSVCKRTLATSPQLHQGEVIGLIVTYVVLKPREMLLVYSDVHANLDQRAQALLSEHFDKSLPSEALTSKIREQMRSEFDRAGVDILGVAVAQRSWVIPIKQVSDWGMHEDKKL